MLTRLAKLTGLLHRDEQCAEPEEVEHRASREQLSRYLPYDAYEADTREYLNSDKTFGRIWECSPLTFLGDRSADDLASLLRQEYPKDTVIQFILYPDDDIDGLLDRYLALKTRDAPIAREAAQRYADHLSKGRRGLRPMQNIPVRNFRLFVTIKSRTRLSDERVAMIAESLRQAGLAPRPLEPSALLAFLRALLNGERGTQPHAYDTHRLLRKQILRADAPFESLGSTLRVGKRFAACLTPKSMPSHERVDPLGMNRLIGGIRGPEEDTTQLTSPFLWTTTIFFNSTAAAIQSKAGTMMAQRAGGTIAKKIKTRVDELLWVLDDLNTDRYVDVISCLWVFGDTQEELNEDMARAAALWDAQKFEMQRETWIASAMFIVALPFGLLNEGSNTTTLDRHFQVSAKAAALMLPVQADFAGRMDPVLMYVGRKGQLITVDVFDKGANNHNWLLCAASGAGKSFQTNYLVSNYYGTGAKIRIVDIGYSYEKQCMCAKGRYIDIGQQAKRMCLNPFSSAGQGDDMTHNELTTAQVVLTMIYSSTGTLALSETHHSLAKDAVRFSYERDGGLRGVDHVEEYLRTYPKLAGDHGFAGAREMAHEMAFNIRDFTSAGKYGTLFNGKSTLDLSSDDFVVLELEQLLVDPELFQVIAVQVINAVTQSLYLSDRTSRVFNLFEESWKYIGSSTRMIELVIAELYRRARKYGGSTGVVTQSPLDIRAFGPTGAVIKSNSAFRIFLESSDYQLAVKEGVLEYDGLLLDLARSVRNHRPYYSEMLLDTPFGAGVARLCPDPWTYWSNTSTAHEVAKFKSLIGRGLDAKAAIDLLSGG